MATLTDDEMLALGRLRGLRFQLLMSSAVGDLLDKLSPVFFKLGEQRLDRRLKELNMNQNDLSFMKKM